MSAGLNLMYQNILGRTPSQEELQGWQSTGLMGQALYDAFKTAASQELQARRAAAPAPMGNASTMIDANYATLVGRAPTEAERAAWMGTGLTGDALYNAMAQAAQSEQQARNFTATNPWAQEGDAETIATLQQNLQNAVIRNLGGTDTGGTDTGGTGDAGGTDTGSGLTEDQLRAILDERSGSGLTEDQLRAILDERFGTFDARFDEVYDRIGEIGAGNVNDVFGDNYRQGASFQDYDTASFGPALRITPDAPRRNMQQPNYGGTSLQQYQQNRRANISDAPLSTATTQATNLTRQLTQQPVTYGGTTIPNLERDNPMNPRNYTRGTTIAQTPQAPTRNDGTPSYAQGSSVPSYADVWREFDAMDRQRAQQDARRRRMMRGQ